MKGEHDYIIISKEIDFPQKKTFVKKCIAAAKGNIWHRVVITGGQSTVFLYASDKDHPEPPFDFRHRFEAGDHLLTQYQGKYMYVKVESQGEDMGFSMKLYPYQHSFTRYLPEMYQTKDAGDFMNRFVAVFQSIYLDVEERIADIPKQLDPMSNAILPENLLRLSQWLAAEEFQFLQGKKAKEWLLNCVGFYKRSGTREGMVQMIEWYLAQEKAKVFIIEYFWIRNYLMQESIQLHYTDKPYYFTILLFNASLTSYDKKALEKLIQAMKPAHCEYHLVFLDKRIRLSEFTYLGMNSYLGSYEQPVLDDSHYLTKVEIAPVYRPRKDSLVEEKG